MTRSYDAIIVGARIAGSSTALLLARKGYRVLMVDRATFPSDIMSGHYFHQPGVARLKRWGLLERLVALGAPAQSAITFDVGPLALTGAPPPADGVAQGYGPRRYLLDKMLVDAAVEAGAELREAYTVHDLLWQDGAVAGIRGGQRGVGESEERAPITVGADGIYSLVARKVQAPAYNVRPTLTCNYYSYWSGIDAPHTELYTRPGRFIICQPTNDGLDYVGVLWPRAEFGAVRSDIEGSFMRALDEYVPGLAVRVRAGRREERFIGTGDIPNYFRRPSGSGWALVGDSGDHRDPLTAQGMTDALREAELLAEAIDAGLSGRAPMAGAMAAYESARNAAVLPMYEFTCQLAALQPPPPEMQALFAALAGNQRETDRFLGLVAGTTSIPEYMTPANINRIVKGAARPDEMVLALA